MDNNSVKDNISKLRKLSGMSQSDMAEKIGLSRNAYRNIEKGDTKILSDTVEKIADALKTSPEELILGYKPQMEDSLQLQEIQQRYSDNQSRLIDEYERKIEALKKENNSLRELINSLQETLNTKNEIIGLLRKIGSEKQIL